MYPDYGKHLWEKGVRGKVRIVGAVVSSISTAPNKRTKLSFDMLTDRGVFRGDLNTRQSKRSLLNFLQYGKLLVIDATLSTRQAVDGGGLEYDGLTGAMVEVSDGQPWSDRTYKTFEAKSIVFDERGYPGDDNLALPAWFTSRMMSDSWFFGLLMQNRTILCIECIDRVWLAADDSLWLDVTMLDSPPPGADSLPKGIPVICAPTERNKATIAAAHVVAAFEMADT
jgi:hypothetical protein